MGKIIINRTASEPTDMKKDGSKISELNFEDSAEMIMPIEHYVTVSAKVENPEAGVSVEGVKSAPRKKPAAKKEGAKSTDGVKAVSAANRKKNLDLPEGSIGAAVLNEKEKAAKQGSETKDTSAAKAKTSAAAAKASNGAKKASRSVDGMTTKSKMRMVEVTEVETTPEEEFEAHRPREKQEEEEEEENREEQPRLSRPKAALVAVLVTLLVAAAGGLLIGLFTKTEVPRCVVQFEANGGSRVESEEVVCGELVGRPVDPTKEGFTFQSWIYGGMPFDFEGTTIDEDMILVAKWVVEEGVETVKIHFDTNGGSAIDDVEVKKGSLASAPVDPTRTSYEFMGWTLNGEAFDFSQPIKEDITLVAQWKAVAGGNPSNNNAANSNKPAQSGSSDTKPQLEKISVDDMEIEFGGATKTMRRDIVLTPKNASYSLSVSGYNPNNGIVDCKIVGMQVECTAKKTGTTAVTIYDKESGQMGFFNVTVKNATPEEPVVEEVTVSFDSDGGSSVAAKKIKKGETVEMPKEPTKAGYKFAGWTLNGEEFDFSKPVNGDITLKAKWEKVEEKEPEEGGNTGGGSDNSNE